MGGRGNAVYPHRDIASFGNFTGDFGGGQYAAFTGFGALRELDFDHFDLIERGAFGKGFGVEVAVFIAAAEVAGADFPNQITAVFAMIGADAAFAGVVGEAAFFGTFVERFDGGGGKGTEAHGGNVEYG